MASVVTWLASDAAADVTGQVLVVRGDAVELLQGWRPVRRVTTNRAWDAARLLSLRAELFGPASPRRVPPPIAQLFTAGAAQEDPTR